MYIHKAFELARWTEGQTGTNPAVGCIVVKNDRIIGIGAHLKQGSHHAEVQALTMAGSEAEGADLYCTLEPCSHFGSTPPCVNRIIEARIKRVFFCVKDKTLNSGIQKMKDHGIEVIHCPDEAVESFYKPFFLSKENERAYCIIKMALTQDGKSADDHSVSKWFTNALSREDVHKTRHLCDAVMVGHHTYNNDAPILDCRLHSSKSIKKVVITSKDLKLHPEDLKENELKRMLIVSSVPQSSGAGTIILDELTPEKILKALYHAGIQRVMLEGGMTTIRQFMDHNMFDEIHHYIAPKILGGTSRHQYLCTDALSTMDKTIPLSLVSVERFDNDVKLVYRKEG